VKRENLVFDTEIIIVVINRRRALVGELSIISKLGKCN